MVCLNVSVCTNRDTIDIPIIHRVAYLIKWQDFERN